MSSWTIKCHNTWGILDKSKAAQVNDQVWASFTEQEREKQTNKKKQPCKISSATMKRYIYFWMGEGIIIIFFFFFIAKLSLSTIHPVQTSSFPTRCSQKIFRQTGQVAKGNVISNFLLLAKHVTLMPLTRPRFIEYMSSIPSLALAGRAPRHCRFMALGFVYGTFRDTAWCYRHPVYISAGLEAKI